MVDDCFLIFNYSLFMLYFREPVFQFWKFSASLIHTSFFFSFFFLRLITPSRGKSLKEKKEVKKMSINSVHNSRIGICKVSSLFYSIDLYTVTFFPFYSSGHLSHVTVRSKESIESITCIHVFIEAQWMKNFCQ